MTEAERSQKRAASGYFAAYAKANRARRNETSRRWRLGQKASKQHRALTLQVARENITGKTLAERFKNYRNATKLQEP